MRWLTRLALRRPRRSHATFADYLAAVDACCCSAAPTLDRALEQAWPRSPSAPSRSLACAAFAGSTRSRPPGIARRGRRLSIALQHPRRLSGFLGIVPSERTSGDQPPPGLDHQGRPQPRPTTAGRGRPPLPPPPRASALALAAPPARQRPARDRAIAWRAQRAPAPSAGSHLRRERRKPAGVVDDRTAPASSPVSSGRPPRSMTDPTHDHRARRRCRGGHERPSKAQEPSPPGPAKSAMGSRPPGRPRPLLDSEPATNTGS